MKKASIFVVGVVVVAFIVLTSAFIALFYKYSKTGVIGDEQYSLMNSYLKGDKALLYTDTAAEQAYKQAAYWFTFNAGFYGVSTCNIDGLNIINGECDFNDDIIKENFNKYLNHFFNQYSKNYEDSYIPFKLYDFYERKDEIVGIAKYPVVVLTGSSNERVDCFPGRLQEFPVAWPPDIEDTWGSEENPDSIKIKVGHGDTAVVSVIDGKIKGYGKWDGEEFIEIISDSKESWFHYSHLKVSDEMKTIGGNVWAGDVIGSTFDYINFKAYREDVPMNPICALKRIKKSNEVKGYYYVKPHISFEPKYFFFEDFNKVMEVAQEMINKCGTNITCVNNYNNKKLDDDLILHVGDCEGNEIISNDVFGFCVKSEDDEKGFYVYDEKTKSMSFKLIEFRFALDLSKEFTPPELPLPEAPTIPPGPPGEPISGRVIWPAMGIVSQCFGEPTPGAEPKHGGVDIGAEEGTEVRAVARGIVVGVRIHTREYTPPYCESQYTGGTYIVLYHPDLGIYTKYSHLSRVEDGIREGDEVEQSQIIGYVGNTGCSTGDHLDFRVSKTRSFTWNTAMDPADYLPGGCVYLMQTTETILMACTKGEKIGDDFKVTRYFTALEGEYGRWYEFYKDVRMQGSGISFEDNCLYRYHSITKDKATSECNARTSENSRGTTGTGTNPTRGKTIAVNPNFIDIGSSVYVDFGDPEWNGFFVAEDTGGAFTGGYKGIDVYAGVGQSYRHNPPPSKANIYKAFC